MQKLPGASVGGTSGTEHAQTDRSYPQHQQLSGQGDRREAGDERSGAAGGSPSDLLCHCEGHCHCHCGDDCGLPWEARTGSIRRLIQVLECEMAKSPRFPDAPKDARNDFEKALQEAEKEYQGLDEVVKKYREYHCTLECELERAKTWCEELRTWCPAACEWEIAALWRDCYEGRERTLRCDWLKAYETLKSTRDCLERAGMRVERARADYEATRNFEKTLRERFAELKTLYDKARGYVDTKERGAVCAILLEYRKVYEHLHELILSDYWRERCRGRTGGEKGDAGRPCRPPDDEVKAHNPAWLRERLNEALKELLIRQYCRFCWHQQRIDHTADRDRRRAELDAFVKRRREDFIQEARDECKAASAGGPATAREAAPAYESAAPEEDAPPDERPLPERERYEDELYAEGEPYNQQP